MIKKNIFVPVIALFLVLGTTSFKNDYFEIAKQIEIFTTLFKELNMNYVDETNPAELMDTAIKNMLEDLDPYTKFLNEQDVEEFKINSAGEYSGIGAMVRTYKDKIIIIEPYKDYPADKAGLKAGDEIIKVDNLLVSENEDAGELLKGANNTQVSVSFIRQGETKTATLTRAGVEVDAVPFYQMANQNTGYIVLSKFNAKASQQTRAALEDLKSMGAKKIILDLRNNPGGLLSEAINVTNLFIPKGELIVTTKSKVKKFNRDYKTKNKAVDTEIPLVVLINGNSASASEIVSGSIQDLDRGVLIGARSFGKGLVQRPLRLTYGTQLKVTISRYYTPSGRCIQSLDYWNRDDDGKAIKNTAFKDFNTRNGRKVQDGGGVLPDIAIAALQSNPFIDALMKNHVVFDYATQYFYSHQIKDPKNFTFSNADFQAFKNHLAQNDFSFESQTEVALKESLNEENNVLLNNDLKNQVKTLLGSIDKSKLAAVDRYQKELRKNLEDEIVKRYFYREGLYQHYLSHDEAILAAKELLADTAKYQNILK